MKTVIKEYAGTALALIITCLLLLVLGGLLFHKDGIMSQIIQMVLEGGI